MPLGTLAGPHGPAHGGFDPVEGRRVPEDLLAVDDDGEPSADPMAKAEPDPLRGVEADDFDSDPVPELSDEALREVVRAGGVFEEERGRLVKLLADQGADGPIHERLRARRPARLQDRGEEADELDSRGPGRHDPERGARG